jgi:hypothetical protein
MGRAVSEAQPVTVAGSMAENPYVGPRAFRAKEHLYGRERETRELADMLISQRIVLLHAPSGAGKTSLIQAGLTDRLKDEDFAATPPLRVNTRAPKNRRVRNPYVYSTAFYLLGEDRPASELAQLTLTNVIEAAAARAPDDTPVVVLDQFEEILLIEPTDRENQEGFFAELGEALATTGAWALLSMREEYMGGLDRFVRYIPGHLSATYRLEYLGHAAAKEAIQLPAAKHSVDVTDSAAAYLVRELAKMKVQGRDQEEKEVLAPYVHPYELQVVCRKLWESVRAEKETHGEFRRITRRDAKQHSDIEGALRGYYAGVVETVARRMGADEAVIRRWFATDLISPQRFRSQTLVGPTAGDVDPLAILHELESLYVIRSDTRQDATWYELSHDRLIDAVLVDNENWERPRLQPWQLAAREWERNEDPQRLLTGATLRAAPSADSKNLTHAEKNFLRESKRAERGVIARTRLFMSFGLIIVVQGLVILALIVVLVARR